MSDYFLTVPLKRGTIFVQHIQEQVMRNRRNITMNRIILGGAFIIIAVLGVFGLFDWNGKKSIGSTIINSTGSDIDQLVEFPLSGIDSLDISTVSADIVITRTDSRTVTAHLTGTSSVEPELKGERQGSAGTIRVIWPKSISTNARNMLLKISLPRDFQEKLHLNTVSGEIEIPREALFEELAANSVSGAVSATSGRCSELDLSTVSGKISVSDFTTGNLHISTTSGDITFTGSAGELDIRSVSGDAEIGLDALTGDVTLKNTSGDVKLKFSEPISAAVTFTTVSGDLQSDFPILTTSAKRTSLEGTIGSGTYRIVGNTVSGDIQILRY